MSAGPIPPTSSRAGESLRTSALVTVCRPSASAAASPVLRGSSFSTWV